VKAFDSRVCWGAYCVEMDMMTQPYRAAPGKGTGLAPALDARLLPR
jgi:hypothetical protein